jgi:signal transduction histidine kinase
MSFLGKWNTIRLRLTLLYGSAFFLAGLVFIGVMYYQLNNVIGAQLVYRGVIPQDAAEGQDSRPVQPVIVRIESGRVDNKLPDDLLPRLGDSFDAFSEMEERLARTRAEARSRVLVVSMISVIVVSAIAAAIGWVLAGRALLPLRQITATARGIADRNLHQRVGMQGPQDEIKDLADTLDGMLERLDRAFDSQARFIANASHELRTPLAINRTLIEVALLKEENPDTPLAQLGANLLAINQRHERLIDGLLMLASSEQEIADPQDVDLEELARHVLTEAAPTAQAAGVDLRPQFASAPCRGDPVLLERLVQNLVDNALRYNLPKGGWLSVATGTDAQGRARLTVENPGAVIPSYEVPRLFEPFRRLGSSERQADAGSSLGRRGAGLGLSIVRSVVTSHGGEVSAVAREAGGFRIEILLPSPKPNAAPTPGFVMMGSPSITREL